jgi:hypothetical protein
MNPRLDDKDKNRNGEIKFGFPDHPEADLQ